MKNLSRILIDLNLIKLTPNRLKYWRIKRKTELLYYALIKGTYDVRIIAIQEIAKLNSNDVYNILFEAINDKVRIVSLTAIESLKIIGLKPEHSRKVDEKIDYWNKKEIEEHNNLNKRKLIKNSELHWERKSKETLENVKQMLKKPMNTGKWF